VSYAAAPDCTAADVWQAILLLEIEPEVGVEESTWGVIKALFDAHP
jgi:hypothetical protein